MTFDDLLRELAVSSEHAVCIDVRNLNDAPGYVRTTTLHAGNQVTIEFDVWGLDEGGLYFRAAFATLEAAVKCVEVYVGRPLGEWGQAEYPPRPAETGTAESHRQFRELLALGGPALPAGGEFRTHSDYWLQFMPASRPAADE